MPTSHVLHIRRWRPRTPVIAVAVPPRLELNRHIRKSLHDARFAPDLSVIPKRADDEHEVYEAQDDLAGDANTRAKFRVWGEGGVRFAGGARAPDKGHYGDDEGEYGPGEPDSRESEEDPDVPEYSRFRLLRFLLAEVSGS